MNIRPPEALKPRKTPLQARSAATVTAIFEATIQVLLADGQARLTTTRVAERAGVPVGTLCPYFPHLQFRPNFNGAAERLSCFTQHRHNQLICISFFQSAP